MFSREFIKKYRFVLDDENVPVFESRYFAQKFIDEFISQWFHPHRFIIDSGEDGFRIFYKGQLRIDQFDEPMVKYTYK